VPSQGTDILHAEQCGQKLKKKKKKLNFSEKKKDKKKRKKSEMGEGKKLLVGGTPKGFGKHVGWV